jgi:hypothetical protein
VNNQTQNILTGCTVFMIIACPLLALLAVRGEKRMIKDKFVKGFFLWPDVIGDKVPIVARRYKIMIVTFASSLFIFTLFCALSRYNRYH